MENGFVDEAGEPVYDFTPAVVGVEVEVPIFMFTSSWAWKKVVDGDGPRGGLYPKCPFFNVGGRRVMCEIPTNKLLKISGLLLSVCEAI